MNKYNSTNIYLNNPCTKNVILCSKLLKYFINYLLINKKIQINSYQIIAKKRKLTHYTPKQSNT